MFGLFERIFKILYKKRILLNFEKLSWGLGKTKNFLRLCLGLEKTNSSLDYFELCLFVREKYL